MKDIWKKVSIFFLAMLIASFSGCYNASKEKKEKTVAEQKENLVIWAYYETQAQRNGLNELVKNFNQSQNEYEVEWEYVPMTGFVKGLSSAYTENKLPDMAILDNPDTPSLIRLGMFEDITEQVKNWNLEEEYYQSILNTVKYEERYYGLPLNCNSTALFYNKHILEEAGVTPPSDWQELKEAAEKLTTKDRSGFLMCGMEGEQGAFQILPWILSAGGTVDAIDGLPWTETFEFFSELLKSGSMSANCINLTQTDVAREFNEGKTAMMQNGPWVLPMLKEAGTDYGIVSLPENGSPAAVLGGENITIIKGKNAEGSLVFLNYCMENEELFKFCKSASILPAKISAAKEMAAEDEDMKVFEEQMNYAVSRTSVPQWETIAQKLTNRMYSLVQEN